MGRIIKPKTVLLIIETLNRGGIENVLLRLIPKLKEEGWSSTIITLKDGGEMLQEYQKAGITVIPLNQRYFLTLKTGRLIRDNIRDLQPDLIVTTLFKADMIGRLFLRFFVQQPIIPYLVTTYNHPRYWIARVFEWLTKPLASHYIANSEAVQKFYEERLGVKSGKIVVAPNGVDTDAFQSADAKHVRSELKLPSNAFVVTCVANLAPNKGQADLLDAFDRAFSDNQSAYLLLVGDGGERETLTAQRETLRSKNRILLLGRRTDVPSILKITTVFALPTLFEGMSTALLEAMAANKAIITTDIPENKVLLTHNQSALLIKPRNRQQLGNALNKMYADSTLRDRLSQSAFDYVGKNYSISKMAKTFAVIFNLISPTQTKTPIIHVINSLEIGGAENMLLKTLPLLNSGEFEQIVVTLFRPGDLAPEFRRRGITVIDIGLRNLADIHALRNLVHRVSELQPGLVITYLFHASLVGRLYLQQRISAPVIPFLRSTYNYPRYLSARLFERATKGLVGHYFANSEAVRDYYVENIGVKSRDITVIHNGIDTSIYERVGTTKVLSELQLPKGRMVISCIANLAVNKGHAYLLEAFEGIYQDYPDSYLLIVGEGQERRNLEHQVEAYQSKNNIRFLGRRTDIPEILAITDIFVLPTLFEGLSNAILEAMAAQCTVVTTDIPENRVMINSEETGLLVPTKNVTRLKEAILELIRDKLKRQKLGQNAHKFIKANFDLKHVAEQLEDSLQAFAMNKDLK